MRVRVLLLLASLASAGCATPPSVPSGAGADVAEAGQDSQDVDLHDSILDLSTTQGQPTMLVALHVTRDMWVRPKVGTGAGPSPIGAPAGAYEEYWVLCPWARSVGLPQGLWYHAVPFWLEGGTLRLATQRIPLPPGHDGLRDESGGVCLTKAYGPDRGGSIAADEPRDGVLALLLTANGQPARFPRGEPATPPPEWRLLLGIASRECPPSLSGAAPFCPPEKVTRARPMARAPLALYAGADMDCPSPCMSDEEDAMPPCPEACGFTVEDERTRLAGAPLAGHVGLTRVTDHARGVTFGFATAASAPFEASLGAGGLRASSACDTLADNQVVQLLLAHDGPAEFRMDVEFARPNLVGFGAYLFEIPLDLEDLGLTLAPYARGTSFVGTVSVECLG